MADETTVERKRRKVREGIVVSTKMDKTVVVSVVDRVQHSRYRKTLQRTTKRVLIGSLCIASRIASRASGSLTPDSSNITRPGLTLATHHSGEPLPDPIRVSAGFLVSGRSG